MGAGILWQTPSSGEDQPKAEENATMGISIRGIPSWGGGKHTILKMGLRTRQGRGYHTGEGTRTRLKMGLHTRQGEGRVAVGTYILVFSILPLS